MPVFVSHIAGNEGVCVAIAGSKGSGRNCCNWRDELIAELPIGITEKTINSAKKARYDLVSGAKTNGRLSLALREHDELGIILERRLPEAVGTLGLCLSIHWLENHSSLLPNPGTLARKLATQTRFQF